uniref:Sec translocon accessory complex subunit YajC n=1 Tax=Candidatus Aschnera chinzeii TaxID=1485666 RepID=A0AAT9G4E0_9ENTR|nr:MAG: preprotein translocase subunit YajC [Candidatus Aschnera chinzeii]
MNIFISESFASAGNPSQGNPYFLLVMLILFGLIFYFMILRPQQKRTKEHKKLIDSVTPGDEILTTGGLLGCVTKVNKSGYIIVALNENNEAIIKRDFIAAILPKGTIKSLE